MELIALLSFFALLGIGLHLLGVSITASNKSIDHSKEPLPYRPRNTLAETDSHSAFSDDDWLLDSSNSFAGLGSTSLFSDDDWELGSMHTSSFNDLDDFGPSLEKALMGDPISQSIFLPDTDSFSSTDSFSDPFSNSFSDPFSDSFSSSDMFSSSGIGSDWP